MKTPPGVTYNNLLWHKVELIKVGSQVDLQINDENILSTSLTAQDLFLDIDLGIFLGGYGKFLFANMTEIHLVSLTPQSMSDGFRLLLSRSNGMHCEVC